MKEYKKLLLERNTPEGNLLFSVVGRSKEDRVKLNMCLLVKVKRRRHMCLLDTQGDTDLSWRQKETHVMVILVGDTRRYRFKMEKQGDTSNEDYSLGQSIVLSERVLKSLLEKEHTLGQSIV